MCCSQGSSKRRTTSFKSVMTPTLQCRCANVAMPERVPRTSIRRVCIYRIEARAAARRSSSPSYQSFKPRAESALRGFSPTQKPMLAMRVKLSPRARKYVMTSKRSGTGGHTCARRSAAADCFRMLTNGSALQYLLQGPHEIADIPRGSNFVEPPPQSFTLHVYHRPDFAFSIGCRRRMRRVRNTAISS